MEKLKRERGYTWENAITELLRSMESSAESKKIIEALKMILSQKMTVPAKHQIGDKVKVLMGSSLIEGASVKRVIFSYEKVHYDLTVEWTNSSVEEPNGITISRLYNVDGNFVSASN